MIKKFFFLFLLISSNLFSQKYLLDNVTKEELLLEKHRVDTSASAAIIFKKAKTKFEYKYDEGYRSTTEVEIKLKIFKKDALKWGNFSIPYYVGYKTLKDEIISIDKAITYNLEGNAIVKEKVASSAIVKQEINDYWNCKKVLFPNVKVGSIIELKYTFKTQNLSELPSFQYQYDIPVDFAEYKSEIPEFYIYKTIKNGFVDFQLDEKIENGSTTFTNSFNQSKSFFHKKIISVIKAENIAALISEKFVNNIDNYYGKIEFELQTIRLPEENVKNISKTWNDVAREIFKEKMFGNEIEKFDYFMTDLKLIISTNDSENEKLEKIFNFLQKRMTWNNKYNYLPSTSLESLYNSKVASSGEINLILVAMLRMAGLNADPVLISTRDVGFALFPNRNRLNSVLVRVKLNDRDLFCDATSKFTTPNWISLNHISNYGQVINKEGIAEEVKVMPNLNSRKVVNLVFSLNEGMRLVGKMKIINSGYNALEYREKYYKISNENYLQIKESEFSQSIIKNFKIDNKFDLNKPIIEDFDFENINLQDVIGDKIYINPLLFLAINENPFKSDKRNYPIEFPYPQNQRFSIVFNIPDGFLVDKLPSPINLSLSDKSLSYLFNIAQSGNQIQIISQLDLNTSIISSDDYEELKEFFNLIIKKQTEKIVLKKA